jgi:hypothetical protein
MHANTLTHIQQRAPLIRSQRLLRHVVWARVHEKQGAAGVLAGAHHLHPTLLDLSGSIDGGKGGEWRRWLRKGGAQPGARSAPHCTRCRTLPANLGLVAASLTSAYGIALISSYATTSAPLAESAAWKVVHETVVGARRRAFWTGACAPVQLFDAKVNCCGDGVAQLGSKSQPTLCR